MAFSLSALAAKPQTPIAFLFSAPVLIFFLALILRISMAVWLPERVIWPDGHRYENVAVKLLKGEGFGDIKDNRRSVPTQPILIAAVYSVFGKSYLALRITFAILGAATCVMGYALAKQLFGVTPAVIAGLLLAVYPHFIYLSALFEYPQTFFISVMALYFVLFFRFIERDEKPVLFAAGLSLGVAILSVPTVLIYVPFACFHLLSDSLIESFKRALIILLAIAIPVGAWSLRNYAAYDQFILVNAAGGTNFWAANNETYYRFGKKGVIPPCGTGYEDTKYCRELRAMWKQQEGQNRTPMQQILEAEAASWSKGLDFIRSSPERFAELTVRKFFAFWSPIPDAVHADAEHGARARDLISVASYIPILLLALWGVYLSIGAWRRLMPIYTYFLSATAPYCLFLPTMRYRLPLDFFLILLAAVALAYWREHKGRAVVVWPRNRETP